MLKTFIQLLQEQEKIHANCKHKKVKLFEYKQEYPAGGLRCVKCGFIVKFYKTKIETV